MTALCAHVKPGFSNLGTIGILGPWILCLGGALLCIAGNSTSGLYPLEASSVRAGTLTHPPTHTGVGTTKNVSKH